MSNLNDEDKDDVYRLTTQLDIALGKIREVGEYHYGLFCWDVDMREGGMFIGEAEHEWNNVDNPSNYLEKALTECFSLKDELENMACDGSSS